MVEMIETAHILNNASAKSLVILDEIGRGTSTFDGVSIAWAVCEYLTKTSGPQPKTLFATHYHELTSLEKLLPGIKNYNVMVREYGDKVVFLRKISPGGADRSYGIQVGKLAGLPDEVVKRAQEILLSLENGSENNSPVIERIKIGGKGEGEPHPVVSLSNRPNWRSTRENFSALPLFNQPKEEHPLVKEIKELDIQNMTPLEALNKLNQLKERAKSYSVPGQLISIPRNQQKG
jgi:DNA mismatch repair protein MutS